MSTYDSLRKDIVKILSDEMNMKMLTAVGQMKAVVHVVTGRLKRSIQAKKPRDEGSRIVGEIMGEWYFWIESDRGGSHEFTRDAMVTLEQFDTRRRNIAERQKNIPRIL